MGNTSSKCPFFIAMLVYRSVVPRREAAIPRFIYWSRHPGKTNPLFVAPFIDVWIFEPWRWKTRNASWNTTTSPIHQLIILKARNPEKSENVISDTTKLACFLLEKKNYPTRWSDAKSYLAGRHPSQSRHNLVIKFSIALANLRHQIGSQKKYDLKNGS